LTDLVQRIKAVNAESEKVNKSSVEAQAKRKLLLQQISEKVSAFEEMYGISFPSINNLEEFEAFLKDLLDTQESKLQEQVEQAEKVIGLINSGNIEEAQQLLGYKPEKVHPLNNEKVAEDVVEGKVEEVKEVAKEVIEEDLPTKEVPTTPQEVVDLEDLDGGTNEEEVREEVQEVVKPTKRPRKRSIATTNFDMNEGGVSLDDLDSVAGEEANDFATDSIVEEEVTEVKRPIRRRRPRIVNSDEETSTISTSTAPIKTGGEFNFGD
jgi:hypothetical protein